MNPEARWACPSPPECRVRASQRGDASSGRGSGKDAVVQVALLAGVLDGRGEAQQMLCGNFVGDLIKIRKHGHGRKAEHLLDIGSDVDLGVKMIGDGRGEQSEKQSAQRQGQRLLQNSRNGRVQRRHSGHREVHARRERCPQA